MNLLTYRFTEILPDLYAYHGAVNTVILKSGDRAVLIDCDDTLTPARLEELGIQGVERIYCTQHRRPNTAGIPAFQAAVFAPHGERRQFKEAASYWQDWRNRWHLYHFRPGSLAPLENITVSETVCEGDTYEWGGFTIRVYDTPGMTDGAVSYSIQPGLIETAQPPVIATGDLLYAAGQVWDVHSLQKNNGAFSDYHGFLGAAKSLIASLNKLCQVPASCFIPSHGEIINSPAEAARLTVQKIEELVRNYASITSLNYYFPHIFKELRDDPMRMQPCAVVDFPDFIQPVAYTSFAIISDSGALFLIDCGHDSVLETLASWKEAGRYTQLEGCWVTHYHDDHVDSLQHLASTTLAPIFTNECMAEILAHPTRFFLPCISPAAAPVAYATKDGETWRWHEFELTALHLPGQSYYHGGLLVRGHGVSVLFSGDSFSPAGIDDYTAGNRNFLGAGQGYRRCIDLLRQYQPDLILNQHQQKAFHFSDEQLDYMEQILVAREALLTELLPWSHPNYGIDDGWIRTYPYECETCPGGNCVVEIRAANHTNGMPDLTVEPVLQRGWSGEILALDFPPDKQVYGERIVSARISISVPSGTPAGCYPVAFRVTWAGRYLGQVCHALIRVWS